MKIILQILLIISFSSTSIQAQKFEIRSTYLDASTVSVELRVLGQPAPKSTDFLTDLVFGLKWDNTLNLNIANVLNTSGFNINKSDVEKMSGNFEYQAFYANATPFLIPTDWQHKTWVEVVRIQFEGPSLQNQMIKIAEPEFNENTNPNFGFNLKDHYLNINGFSSSDEHYISLLSFEARSQNNDVQLFWTSEIEINSEHFILERSNDASKWSDLGTIEAQVNSNIPNNYSFLDEDVYLNSKRNEVLYYRLKMVKKDGSFDYSSTQLVQRGSNYFDFTVHPNSASDQSLNIIRSSSEKSVDVYIFNYTGKLVQKSTLADHQNVLQLNDFISGVYFVRIGDQIRKVFIP